MSKDKKNQVTKKSEKPEAVRTGELEQIEMRREKLAALRTDGRAFPNDFRRNWFAGDLQYVYGLHDVTEEFLDSEGAGEALPSAESMRAESARLAQVLTAVTETAQDAAKILSRAEKLKSSAREAELKNEAAEIVRRAAENLTNAAKLARETADGSNKAARYSDWLEGLPKLPEQVKVAGRLMSRRMMGKTAFVHIEDMTGRIQLFIRQDKLGGDDYAAFKRLDIGDIIGAEGAVFYTKTGELSVRVETMRLLTKSLRPLPDKHHGLADPEMKYRRRYVDLMMSNKTRKVFSIRSLVIQHLREFLIKRRFVEVETPMMHPIAGGALAKPFATHHNALDRELFLRIAPELYLKRLVVGGMERVFEINRNFRNEGVSTKHNPEFTMLEFYRAYSDYRELMDLSEEMLRSLCEEVCDGVKVSYQGYELDFGKPFARMTMRQSLVTVGGLDATVLNNLVALEKTALAHGVEVSGREGIGYLQMELFEKLVEDKLIQPTFITAYPVEVSPLSRRNDDDPTVTDRFELFIAGREIANGFSELNDPEDQADRFRAQLAADGADEKNFDADYIRALEYALPPTAGEGIGIDRLVMLLTDSPSIRDVLLFPLMRDEG